MKSIIFYVALVFVVAIRVVTAETLFASGDVNGDGAVNVADMLLLQNHVLGRSLLNTDEIKRADVYPMTIPDGDITQSDIVVLKKIILANN